MPKVSQAYRDARREQILAAAKRCFLREGFHETSMQDLFAESGLSSGAVYRYFPSKEDMVLAIAEENLRDVTALIRAMTVEQPGAPLGAVLAEVLEVVQAKHAETDLGAMAVLVWSEALRTPALAEQLDVLFGELRGELTEIVREHQARDALPREAGADALTALLISIVPGFIVQLAMFGQAAVDGVPAAVRALWPT